MSGDGVCRARRPGAGAARSGSALGAARRGAGHGLSAFPQRASSRPQAGQYFGTSHMLDPLL